MTFSVDDLPRWLDRAIAEADGAPNPFLAVVLSWQAAVTSVHAVATDDRALAAETAILATRVSSMLDALDPPWRMYCRLVAGMSYTSLCTAGLEDRSTAEQYYRAAADDATPDTPYRALRSTLYEYLSLFRLLAGDGAAALALAQEAPSGEGRWPMFGPNSSASRVLAAAANGDPEGARAELRAMHEAFRRVNAPNERETVCMYAGALAAIDQDWERAAILLAAGRGGIRAGAEAALVYYHYRDETRTALGGPAARALRDRGVALPVERAIAIALDGAAVNES